MPDTYPNPYTVDSPIGSALRNLAGVITRQPSEAQNIVRAEQALKLKRENENTIALGDVFRRYGTPEFDRNLAMDTAIRAGVTGDQLGGYERYGAANTYGATDPRTTNAFVGAGGSYGSTAAGFRENEAGQNARHTATLDQQQRQFDSTPQVVDTPTGPQYVRRADSIGMPAAEGLDKVKGSLARRAMNTPAGVASLNPTEQQFIGAEGKGNPTPRNYVLNGQNYITYDGVTDAQGRPLPSGGYMANAQGPADAVGLRPNVQGQLQQQDISNQRFRSLLGFTRNLAQKDANNFGVTGMVKGAMQDASAVAGNVAQGLGYTGIQEAVNNVRQRAATNGVNPSLLSGVYDPNLPALHTAADLMVYSAAEALAGQSGRSVTDRDVKMFKSIVGDPQEWSGNQEKYLSKLDTIEQILGLNQGVVDQRLRGTAPSPATQVQQPAVSPPQGARRAPDGNYYLPDPNRPGKFLKVQ